MGRTMRRVNSGVSGDFAGLACAWRLVARGGVEGGSMAHSCSMCEGMRAGEREQGGG